MGSGPESLDGSSSSRRPASAYLLFSLTICMYGIGYAWAAQFARGASLFENMGLSDEGVSIAFLAGPICGLLVQPIVGTLSDQTSTRCGRRRPWIAAGLGLVTLSFLTLGDSYALGAALGDRHAFRPRGLLVAVAAFWVLDFSQNAVQLPCRTLVSDVLVPSAVAAGNSMFALFDGLGKLTSYSLAATTLEVGRRSKNEPDWVADARAQFAIAALVATVCVGFTTLTVREPPPSPAVFKTQGQPKRSVGAAVARAWALALKVLLGGSVFSSTQRSLFGPSRGSYELVSVKSDGLDDDDDDELAFSGGAHSKKKKKKKTEPDADASSSSPEKRPTDATAFVERATNAALAEWATRRETTTAGEDEAAEESFFSSAASSRKRASSSLESDDDASRGFLGNEKQHREEAKETSEEVLKKKAESRPGITSREDVDDDDDDYSDDEEAGTRSLVRRTVNKKGAEVGGNPLSSSSSSSASSPREDLVDSSEEESEDSRKLEEDLSVLRRMCFVELGLWFGLSAWQVWGALLVGKAICGGLPAAELADGADPDDDPDVARFTQGTLLFSLGLAGSNLLSLVLAPLYPSLLRAFGARRLMTVSALSMAGLMGALALLPLALRHHTSYDVDPDADSYDLLVSRDARFSATVVLLALLGFPWAAHMNIPWIVVGRAYQDADDVGCYMSILNSSLCVAQLFMGAMTPLLIQLADGSVTVCFAAGAAAGLFAAYHANKLQIPYDETDRGGTMVPAAACSGH